MTGDQQFYCLLMCDLYYSLDGSSNPLLSQKSTTCLSCIRNTMVTDGIGMQGAKASANIYEHYIKVSVAEGLIGTTTVLRSTSFVL